ncbi:MAG: hypothetical protein Q8O65_02155 [Nitrosopumilaceae archaeon]|nr:hypothetical protein [Nitrosopumilaceae archaeon]
MNHNIILILILSLTLSPIYGQSQSNPSLVLHTTGIPYNEFNKIANDAQIIELDKTHSVSWQITIDNKLLYANPNGNAVIRFYDATIPEKFIEIGMGSPPDEKFWVAAWLPENGYVVVHNRLERGWIPNQTIVAAYTDNAGLTINNGERIVVSNLDIENFAISAYSVYGMESSTDPPALNSGNLVVGFISGNPAENPLSMLPFVISGIIGIIIAILLILKKR